EARLALRIADEDIGPPRALGAAKPCDDEGVGRAERGAHVERPAGDHHRDYGDALPPALAPRPRRRGGLGSELERGACGLDLGGGLVAEDRDGRIGLGGEAAVGRQLGEAAGTDDRLLEAVAQRGCAGEVAVVDAGALPGQGPSARLPRDVVSTVARDEEA